MYKLANFMYFLAFVSAMVSIAVANSRGDTNAIAINLVLILFLYVSYQMR